MSWRNCSTKHGPFGSRSDQAHVAPQDVEELRQLVDVGVPQPVSDPGAPRVVVRGPDRAGLALGVAPHAAELDDPEPAAPLPDPLLAVEDRTARGQQDGQRDHREERSEAQESEYGDDRRRPAAWPRGLDRSARSYGETGAGKATPHAGISRDRVADRREMCPG